MCICDNGPFFSIDDVRTYARIPRKSRFWKHPIVSMILVCPHETTNVTTHKRLIESDTCSAYLLQPTQNTHGVLLRSFLLA